MNKIFDYLRSRKNSNDNTFQYEHYGDTNPRDLDDFLGGMHSKQFVRVQSDYFSDLIEEIRDNPNCSYQTYLNDVLKDGYTPKYISVLIKNVDNLRDLAYNEVLVSRICNFMQVPTVYNKCCQKDDKNYILSVDFVKSGERIVDMHELIDEVHGDSLEYNNFLYNPHVLLSNQMFDLSQVIYMNAARAYSKAWKFDRSKYFEDYVKLFLTRRFICRDDDFFPRNFCNIVDDKHNMKLGPAFDCEFSFGSKGLREEDKLNIAYVRKFYPQILQDFCQKYSQLMKKNNLNALFNDIDDQKYVKDTKNNMKEFYENFIDYYNSMDNMQEENYKF